jgi:hypothetical protein
MTTHVNRIADQPLMSSMVVGGIEMQMWQIQKEDIKNHLL